MNRKTTRKNKIEKLFYKYDKNHKNYLTKKEIIKFFNKEFKLNYNKNIMNSFFHIWGTSINNKKIITFKTFKLLFKKPDGFLRDVYI